MALKWAKIILSKSKQNKNRYSKRPKEIFLDKIKIINNNKLNNNIIPSGKSNFIENNQL